MGSNTRVGPYELIECIGSGGMADVYLAIKRSMSNIRRFYAIKAIRPKFGQDARFAGMFVDEARVMSNIRHPNLVTLHDILQQGDQYFIVMEFLMGKDLRRLVRELPPPQTVVDIPVAVGIIQQAARGLHCAHQATSIEGAPLELVHRDISPHNLIVTFDGFVKVLDFGIAKSAVQEEQTDSGVLKGKLSYLSPEQCRTEELDRRADVYSLGVVLYELLSGRKPFEGTDHVQIIRSIMEESPRPPSQLNAAIPDDLEQLVLDCLEKDRAERVASAEKIADRLDAIAANHGWRTGDRAISAFLDQQFAPQINEQKQWLIRMANMAREDNSASLDVIDISYQDTTESPVDLGRSARGTTRAMGSNTVFTVAGELREDFQFDQLLEHASGTVVIDLKGVVRLTSFGIRQWLEMMPKMVRASSQVFLSQVSVPVVNQMVTIPQMTQNVRVASVMAPYACKSCRHAFELPIRIGEAIKWLTDCPRCGASTAAFEEDETYLTVLASDDTLDESLVYLLDRLEADGEESDLHAPVQKRVLGRRTEIDVVGDISERTRWDRLLAGVEGEVRISFAPGSSIDDASRKSLADQLRKVRHQATELSVWGLPVELEDKQSLELPGLSSVYASTSCSDCGAEQFREWMFTDSGKITASCRNCGAYLEQWPTDKHSEHVEPLPVDPEPTPSPPTEASEAAPPVLPANAGRDADSFLQTHRHNLIYAGVVVMLVVAIIAIISL